MKKNLFMAAFACALMVFGNAAFAQSQQAAATFKDGAFSSNVSKNLILFVATDSKVELDKNLAAVSGAGDSTKTLGYKQNDKFVSLGEAVQNAKVEEVSIVNKQGETVKSNVTSISLGKFSKNDTIQFGYQDADGAFHPYSAAKIESDPGYYGGYEADSFYQLDFSKDPFDGMIEIVVGEPLPAPAVTLIVALAAGALFLLYKNRRQRSIQTEQA